MSGIHPASVHQSNSSCAGSITSAADTNLNVPESKMFGLLQKINITVTSKIRSNLYLRLHDDSKSKIAKYLQENGGATS